MSKFQDFEDEFSAIKQCSVKDLDSDPFIKQLNGQKGLTRDRSIQRDKERLNYTFNIRQSDPGLKHKLDSLPNSEPETHKRQRRTSHANSEGSENVHLSETNDTTDVKLEEIETTVTLEEHTDFPIVSSQDRIDLNRNTQGPGHSVVKNVTELSSNLRVPKNLDTPENVTDEIGIALVDKPQEKILLVDTSENLLEEPSLAVSANDVTLMKNTILLQLASPSIPNIDDSLLLTPSKELRSVLSRTVEDGESHMVLLIGPHGLGKTVVINDALGSLKAAENEKFITIKLSGSLQLTEQHAVREIARQLDAELKNSTENSEATTFEQRAISDTFANILRTLEASVDSKKLSYGKADLPIRVIFVIDEVEKYTDTPKQMLLYNLFELTQNPKVPICVVGVTAKINIRDLFEKRVRSRFSQRIITTHLASTLEDYWSNASKVLKVDSSMFEKFEAPQYPRLWNDRIEQLYHRSTGLKSLVFKSYFATKSMSQFKQASMLPVSEITEANYTVNADDFGIYSRNAIDGVEAKIASCSLLELMMVIAAARYTHRSENNQVNFNLAYNEYVQMLKAFNTEATTLSVSGSNPNASHIDSLVLAGIKVTRAVTSARIMRDPWGRLFTMGLLFDALTTSNEVNAHNNLNMYKEIVLEDARMLQLDVSLEEIRNLLSGDSFMERLTKI
ncbi:hypothetical protein PUMCH_002986 [Australozyma saopauloensis]|uniref:Origin recognition complex subunit 4 n=1 Tax=Australozyma saopauloensis TaxID=291208 RepID=A0AAX4HAS6_9ASCO|nr:hypothetical protein PUMCH_002986 [[Candida] saopauloensis]